jgi:hypothetical protein
VQQYDSKAGTRPQSKSITYSHNGTTQAKFELINNSHGGTTPAKFELYATIQARFSGSVSHQYLANPTLVLLCSCGNCRFLGISWCHLVIFARDLPWHIHSYFMGFKTKQKFQESNISFATHNRGVQNLLASCLNVFLVGGVTIRIHKKKI